MTAPNTISAQDARRELADRIQSHTASLRRHEAMSFAPDEFAIIEAALRAEPARGAEEMSLRPDVIAAAWGAWRVRHPHERLGPGPGFREAIAAAIRALPLPQGSEGGGV